MIRNFGYRRQIIMLGVCVLLLGIMVPLASFAKSPSPAAHAAHTFRAIPFEYDPGHTNIVDAEWGVDQGLPDPSSNENYALLLTKIGKTSINAASGASITGASGITLTVLGFSVRADGHCGAGAPRFDVVTIDGKIHFAGCSAATTTGNATDPQGNTWLIKRIDPTNANQMFPVIPSGEKIKSISVIFDEGTDNGQGFTFLDNIDINGVLIGQP